MPALVLSCGRTGTNIAVSILQGNPYYKIDPKIENKFIFKEIKGYKDNYLCKSDVTYLPSVDKLFELLETNKHMKVVWTIRDPRDVLLSKIKRGQLKKDGGEQIGTPSADSTPEGAIESLRYMYDSYVQCVNKYPGRCILIRMEDMIMETERESKKMCDFLSIEYHENMLDFPKRIMSEKKKRYGNKIDKKQVSLWQDWKTLYNNFFTNRNIDMDANFKKIKDIIVYFNYG